MDVGCFAVHAVILIRVHSDESPCGNINLDRIGCTTHKRHRRAAVQPHTQFIHVIVDKRNKKYVVVAFICVVNSRARDAEPIAVLNTVQHGQERNKKENSDMRQSCGLISRQIHARNANEATLELSHCIFCLLVVVMDCKTCDR